MRKHLQKRTKDKSKAKSQTKVKFIKNQTPLNAGIMSTVYQNYKKQKQPKHRISTNLCVTGKGNENQLSKLLKNEALQASVQTPNVKFAEKYQSFLHDRLKTSNNSSFKTKWQNLISYDSPVNKIYQETPKPRNGKMTDQLDRSCSSGENMSPDNKSVTSTNSPVIIKPILKTTITTDDSFNIEVKKQLKKIHQPLIEFKHTHKTPKKDSFNFKSKLDYQVLSITDYNNLIEDQSELEKYTRSRDDRKNQDLEAFCNISSTQTFDKTLHKPIFSSEMPLKAQKASKLQEHKAHPPKTHLKRRNLAITRYAKHRMSRLSEHRKKLHTSCQARLSTQTPNSKHISIQSPVVWNFAQEKPGGNSYGIKECLTVQSYKQRMGKSSRKAKLLKTEKNGKECNGCGVCVKVSEVSEKDLGQCDQEVVASFSDIQLDDSQDLGKIPFSVSLNMDFTKDHSFWNSKPPLPKK